MAMIIKILNKDLVPICAYDGNRWVGNCDVHIMAKAIELIIVGIKDYKARKVMRVVAKVATKPHTKATE